MSGFLLIGKNICPHKSLGHQFVILCAPRPQQPADPIEPPPPPPPLTHSHYKGRGGSAACTLHTEDRWVEGPMTHQSWTQTHRICRSLRVTRGRMFTEISGLPKVEQFSVTRAGSRRAGWESTSSRAPC